MIKDRRIERAFKDWHRLTDKEIKSELRFAEKRVNEPSSEPKMPLYRLIAVALPMHWQSSRALARNDNSGWTGVLDYCSTCLMVFEHFGIRSSPAALTFSLALLMHLAVNGKTPALSKQRKLLDAALEPLPRGERDEVHLAYFASFCAELMATGKAKARGPKGALYRLSEQATGKLTDKVLKDVCEFQLKNSGATEDDDVEFVNFELIPVWWFALERARRGLGLETPRPEHPLFATPFATLPPTLKYDPKKNPLVKRIEALSKG